MESKIAGYKLVPEIKDCEGCYFYFKKECPWVYGSNCDCIISNSIYVPADTAIKVPKENQLDNEQ